MFHQNLFLIAFLINIELLPLPTNALYKTTGAGVSLILFNEDRKTQKSW